jgi:hypothetical protein
MPVVTLNVVETVASTMSSTPSTAEADHYTLIDEAVLDTADYLSCGAEDKEGEFVLDDLPEGHLLLTDLEVILDIAAVASPNEPAMLIELRFNGGVLANYQGAINTGSISTFTDVAVRVAGLSILRDTWNAGIKSIYWKSLDGDVGYPDFEDPS